MHFPLAGCQAFLEPGLYLPSMSFSVFLLLILPAKEMLLPLAGCKAFLEPCLCRPSMNLSEKLEGSILKVLRTLSCSQESPASCVSYPLRHRTTSERGCLQDEQDSPCSA